MGFNDAIIIKKVKPSKSGVKRLGSSTKGSEMSRYIPVTIEDLNVIGQPYNGCILKYDAAQHAYVHSSDATLTCQDVKDCIEGFSALDLSGVIVTLGEINGNITFTAGTTIDRTNTTNTGTQNFDDNYIANYTDSILNYVGTTTLNYGEDTTTNFNGTIVYGSTSITTGTQNFDNSYYGIYTGSTIDFTNSTRNSTGSTYYYTGDIITYTSVTQYIYQSIINIEDTVWNSINNTYNYDGDVFNYNQVTQNFYDSDVNYDEDTQVTIGGDLYLGGDIINITNEANNGSTATQDGGGVTFVNINNVLLCDGISAIASPLPPSTQDVTQLIVAGVRTGNTLSNASNTGAPGIYGSASEMRGLALTPAIVNAANFGASFKFGASNYINVTGFGFTISPTDTITGVKVEVIYTYIGTTLSVDCITMTVYSTDGSTFASGVDVYEAGVLKVTAAKSLDFNSNAIVTDMGGGVARVDITGGGGGGSGLYNVASDSDDFTGDGNEDTWILPSTPLDSNVLHLTTDSGTNLILGIDYLLVGDTITFINIIPLGETIYARWILGNPPVTPVTVNTNTHNAVSGEYIVVTYAAGNTTINLPEAAISNGSVVKVKKFTGEDIRVVTILPYGADLIDGYTGATMNINRTMYTFTCVDGNWYLGD